MDRERAEGGEFVPTVTPDRVLAIFETVDGPVVTSSDVADELDCTGEAARRTLDELHEEGQLGRRKTAGLLFYWRREDETREGPPDGPPPDWGRGHDKRPGDGS